ncbi:DUF2239 family protein [Novosphingobium huizhouense]|uniref:DUF2239 family protein n=1 Tax=Novosphingobium huizhouense TaxID=2866625 RepID=UPI001CD8A20A|nr:DUF2239 family protein [Novosphingobium huizhouense]
MRDVLSIPCSAFAGFTRFAHGSVVDVALALRARPPGADDAPVLVFDDVAGGPLDLDLRGSTADVVRRLGEHPALRRLASQGAGDAADEAPDTEAAPRGRGRPRLGVVAREVTLLPRHWDWLAGQPGGASQALRRLIDEARKQDAGRTGARAGRERAYRFMAAIAGDLPGFEAASRALFAGDEAALGAILAGWPPDVAAHVLELAQAEGPAGNDA